MSSTADGMKAYKPRRAPGSPDDAVYSGAKKSMMDDAQDSKDREKVKSMGYAKGGAVSRRADGIAQRGKTREDVLT